jgi:hypothetical protein
MQHRQPRFEQGEAARKASVRKRSADAVAGLEHFPTDPLFRDAWLVPSTPLVANIQETQLAGNLNRAPDND